MQQRQEEEQAERKRLRDQKQLRLEEAEDRNDQRAINAAKGTRINLSPKKEVGFAWVDGVFWERWVRSVYGVNVNTDGPRIIINDEDVCPPGWGWEAPTDVQQNKQYWDQTVDGGSINPSRSRILETLRDVLSKSPSISSKSTSTRIERVFFIFRGGVHNHPWMTVGLFVSAALVVAFWGRGRMRRNAAGFFGLEGKEGFLGGLQGQGKVDWWRREENIWLFSFFFLFRAFLWERDCKTWFFFSVLGF
jgi:protein disulfide-isomerase